MINKRGYGALAAVGGQAGRLDPGWPVADVTVRPRGQEVPEPAQGGG
jgi:hypothetical protein